MEKAYWLSRKRASLMMARKAVGSEARLIHYDLAGRYGLNASEAEAQAIDPVPAAIHCSGSDGSSDEGHDA